MREVQLHCESTRKNYLKTSQRIDVLRLRIKKNPKTLTNFTNHRSYTVKTFPLIIRN